MVVAILPVTTMTSKIFHPFARKLAHPRPMNRTPISTVYMKDNPRKMKSDEECEKQHELNRRITDLGFDLRNACSRMSGSWNRLSTRTMEIYGETRT